MRSGDSLDGILTRWTPSAMR